MRTVLGNFVRTVFEASTYFLLPVQSVVSSGNKSQKEQPGWLKDRKSGQIKTTSQGMKRFDIKLFEIFSGLAT